MSRNSRKNFKTGRRTRKGFSKSKRSTKANDLTRLAYLVGQIDRGRRNPESRISAAYERGNTKPERVKKKPLF